MRRAPRTRPALTTAALSAILVASVGACQPDQNTEHAVDVTTNTQCVARVTHRGYNYPRAWNGTVQVVAIPCNHVNVRLHLKSVSGTMYFSSTDSGATLASVDTFTALENQSMEYNVCPTSTSCFFGEN